MKTFFEVAYKTASGRYHTTKLSKDREVSKPSRGAELALRVILDLITSVETLFNITVMNLHRFDDSE